MNLLARSQLGVVTLAGVVCFFALASNAGATPILNVGNGHYYEAIADFVDWQQAKTNAAQTFFLGSQGHLATITSQQEQDFINLNFPVSVLGSISTYGYWLGGESPAPTTDPFGFTWITGESFDYANWSLGEPNSGQGAVGLQAIHFHGGPPGTWNDAGQDRTDFPGYMVEFDVVPFVPEPSPVPEPSTFLLLSTGIVGMAAFSRKRRRRTIG